MKALGVSLSVWLSCKYYLRQSIFVSFASHQIIQPFTKHDRSYLFLIPYSEKIYSKMRAVKGAPKINFNIMETSCKVGWLTSGNTVNAGSKFKNCKK